MGKDLRGKELGKGLTQRKDGRYSAKIVINGKRTERYFLVLADAKRWLTDIRTQMERGNAPISPNKTVSDFFEEWLALRAGVLRPDTIKQYRLCFRRHIGPVIGYMRMMDITPGYCQKVINAMSANGLKGSAMKQARVVMNGMFRAAVEEKIIDRSPITSRVQIPEDPFDDKAPKKIKYLTVEEQAVFTEAARSTNYYLEYMLVLCTGLRVSELSGLKWEDIDVENGVIHVQRKQSCRTGNEWYFNYPKTQAGTRNIPLTKDACQLLADLRARENRVNENTPEGCRDLLFLSRKGRPTRPGTYDANLKALCRKAGITHISMHDLRHTFATRMLEAEVDYKTLSVIMGHKSIQTTMDLYVHVTDSKQKAEIIKFEEYMSKVS